ncbi:MAG: hypothetical protein ABL959_11800 [Pyrinomonadaceae bacterium]
MTILIKFIGISSLLIIGGVEMSLCGQTPRKTPTVPERPIEIARLLSDATIAVPEIAVDTLVKVAQSTKVRDPSWRLEILVEASRLTEEVKNHVRRKSVPFPDSSVDTHSGYLSYAYDLKLDRLSLRARIARAFIPHNRDRARQIVFSIGGDLKLKPLVCSDSLVYDVSDIYRATGAVAKAVFSQEEVADGTRGLFIAPWFENIQSPSQIASALELLLEIRGSPVERQILYPALSKAIDRRFDDDRSFTYALERDQLESKVARLVSGTTDAHLKMELLSAFRSFLVKNLHSTRCADNKPKDKERLPDYVANANFLFPEKPLTLEEIKHTELKGTAEITHYWRSANARRLQQEFRGLRGLYSNDSKNKGADVDSEVKTSIFIDNLDSWNASDDETESEIFNQKCVLYRTLVGLVPDGKAKKSIVRSYMRFLANSPTQKQSFIEWMNHAKWLSSKNNLLFAELTGELPNPNFNLIVETKRTGI